MSLSGVRVSVLEQLNRAPDFRKITLGREHSTYCIQFLFLTWVYESVSPPLLPQYLIKKPLCQALPERTIPSRYATVGFSPLWDVLSPWGLQSEPWLVTQYRERKMVLSPIVYL